MKRVFYIFLIGLYSLVTQNIYTSEFSKQSFEFLLRSLNSYKEGDENIPTKEKIREDIEATFPENYCHTYTNYLEFVKQFKTEDVSPNFLVKEAGSYLYRKCHPFRFWGTRIGISVIVLGALGALYKKDFFKRLIKR